MLNITIALLNCFSKNLINSAVTTLHCVDTRSTHLFKFLAATDSNNGHAIGNSQREYLAGFLALSKDRSPILFDDVIKSYHTRTMHPACGTRSEGRRIADRLKMITITIGHAK